LFATNSSTPVWYSLSILIAACPVSARRCALASTRLMANFAQITNARIMMKGDDKKITRRFLFDIILTLPNSLRTKELRLFHSGHFLDRRTLLLARERRSVRRNRIRPNADRLRHALLDIQITIQPFAGLRAVKFLY